MSVCCVRFRAGQGFRVPGRVWHVSLPLKGPCAQTVSALALK